MPPARKSATRARGPARRRTGTAARTDTTRRGKWRKIAAAAARPADRRLGLPRGAPPRGPPRPGSGAHRRTYTSGISPRLRIGRAPRACTGWPPG